MARSKYGPQAASRRSAKVDPARPSGILLHVLLDYWASLPLDAKGGITMEIAALLGHGFHACAGIGCDMASEQVKNNTMTRGRCGDPPCAWYSYQLKGGGAVFGIRACSEHHGSAIEENMWTKSMARAEDFFAWEVMTT